MAGYEQQDAHEYMHFMLNALHTTNGGTSSSQTQCKCFIHEVFYGELQSSITCDHCKSSNVSIEPFLDLSLDIPSEGKKKKGDETTNPEDRLRLEQCLDRFIKGENLTYGCRKCETQRTGDKQFTILKLPPVLCVHLKVI
jgi:ubiquitin carboxyl-terminal hydrolase 22/27/51